MDSRPSGGGSISRKPLELGLPGLVGVYALTERGCGLAKFRVLQGLVDGGVELLGGGVVAVEVYTGAEVGDLVGQRGLVGCLVRQGDDR